MSLALVNWYLGANVQVLVAVALLAGIRAVSQKFRGFLYRHLLWLGYILSASAVLLPIVGPSVTPLSDREPLIPHSAEVWSRSSLHDPAPGDTTTNATVSLITTGASMPLGDAARLSWYLFLSGLVVSLAKLGWDALAISRIIAIAQPLHQRGRVRVLVCERIAIPFSFWFFGRSFIVVPLSLIHLPQDLRMAIRHEAQHHRQVDTKLVYAYQLAKAIFYWNPASHVLARQIFELQELACDEAVIGRGGIEPRSYCGCLLRIAELSSSRAQRLLWMGMAGRSARTLVHRLEAALDARAGKIPTSLSALTGITAITLLVSAGVLLGAPVKDRRISWAEAQRMLSVAQSRSELPIVMNERILAQLNLMLATPDGRAFTRASLARMNRYESVVSGQIRRYGLPSELDAIPLVESGYRNLPGGLDPSRGAGLWMFIESTARRSGLEVNQDTDERLNVPGETDAALRLLQKLQSRFHDWNLALLAFNIGEGRLERAVRETGSRDAWQLIGKGYENDPDYLARLVATILITKNPNVVE